MHKFGVKESDEKVILVIRGQLWPQRSLKVQLKVIFAYISCLAPFFGPFKLHKLHSEDIFREFKLLSF